MKSCFVISSIGSDNTSTRKNADFVFDEIIKPITKKMNYETTRADHINEQGLITSQIISSILSSNLIIADLSDLNPNVFYELGICHTIDTPTILIYNKKLSLSSLPFDVKDHRVLRYDVDNPIEAISDLETRIRRIEDYAFDSNIIDKIFRSQIQSLVFNNAYNSLVKMLDTYKQYIEVKELAEQHDSNGSNYYYVIKELDDILGRPTNDRDNDEDSL